MTGRLPLGIGHGVAFIGSALLLFASVLTVLGLPGYQSQPTLVAPAVLVDLTLGLPVLGYLFLVRPGRLSPSILLPLAVVGLLLGRWWIPAEHLHLPLRLETVALVLEGGLLVLLAFRIRAVRGAFVAAQPRFPYRSDALRSALREVLGPRAGALLFGEAGVLWYAVAGWKRAEAAGPPGTVFPGHRRNAYPAILAALLLAIVAETVALHFLVGLWSEPAAWAVTILSVYSGVWLLGDFHAARATPSRVTGETLHLRAGLRWTADVPWSRIRAIHDDRPSGEAVDLTLWGAPDFWIECRDPVLVQGPFGLDRQVHVLGVGVDQPRELRAAIEARMGPAHSATIRLPPRRPGAG